MLKHLTYVELRWLVWGFAGELPISSPTSVGPANRGEGAAPATLERVLFHLLQEYARHVGHLDVVRELIDGKAGE